MPPYQPTSLPTPIKANRRTGRRKPSCCRTPSQPRLKPADQKTETTLPAPTGRKRGRSGTRQLGNQKLPVKISKSTPKLSPELMRLVLDALRECPILSHAADKAGIHRKTLKYWIERSEAGDDGYDVSGKALHGDFTNTANQRSTRPTTGPWQSRCKLQRALPSRLTRFSWTSSVIKASTPTRRSERKLYCRSRRPTKFQDDAVLLGVGAPGEVGGK